MLLFKVVHTALDLLEVNNQCEFNNLGLRDLNPRRKKFKLFQIILNIFEDHSWFLTVHASAEVSPKVIKEAVLIVAPEETRELFK